MEHKLKVDNVIKKSNEYAWAINNIIESPKGGIKLVRLSLSVSPMSAQVSDLADKEFDYVVVGGGVSSRSIYFC